jgi:hypothetical protein
VDVQEQRTVGGVGSFTAWTQGLYLDPRQDQLEVVVVTTAGVQRCPVKDLFGRDGTGTEARPITTEVKVTNESPGHAPLAGWTADVGPVTAHALLHPPSVPPFARGGGSRVLVGRGDGFLCAVEPDGRTTVLARLPQPITGLMVVPRKKQNGTASATISDFGFRISDFGRDSGFRNSQFAIHNPQSGTASVPYLFVSTADELLCCEADGHILRRYAGGATGLWVVPDKELVVIAALPNGTLARLAIEIGRP